MVGPFAMAEGSGGIALRCCMETCAAGQHVCALSNLVILKMIFSNSAQTTRMKLGHSKN